MYCTGIHDEQGSRRCLEEYLYAHTATALSHGICPECLQAIILNVLRSNDEGASATEIPPFGSFTVKAILMSGNPDPKQALQQQRHTIKQAHCWKRIELDHTEAAIQAQEQEINMLRTRKARLLTELDTLSHQLDAVNRALQAG